MPTVMISTGESSGELYGSLLAKALKIQWPGLHIIGIGGEKMSEEGVTLISRTTDVFGLLEAVSSYRTVKATLKEAVAALKKFIPDVLVLIDYPDFNLRLARVAKDLGIKILYNIFCRTDLIWINNRILRYFCRFIGWNIACLIFRSCLTDI